MEFEESSKLAPLLVQAQDNAQNSKGDCCAKTNAVMKTKNQPLVCKLTNPEIQERKNEVIASLKNKLTYGYRYAFLLSYK